MMFNGKHVITSLFMTEAGDPIEVRRGWRERLWSWPWRPWRRTRTIIPQMPSKTVYVTQNSIVIHPAMLDELRKLDGTVASSTLSHRQH